MALVEAVTGIVSGAIKPILDKFIPDAKERLEAETLIFRAIHDSDLAQIEVNRAEAQSQSLFVAGWRPFIGWVCGSAYAYTFVLQPFLVFALTVLGVGFDHSKLPVLDWSELSVVLFGILGLGAMRSYEKVKNGGGG